ncbi:MAG: hypothetical protein V2I33_17770 [Kangiellaceae bacterium]|nr:hypothetical protein [Kangiellaceae bacterium]
MSEHAPDLAIVYKAGEHAYHYPSARATDTTYNAVIGSIVPSEYRFASPEQPSGSYLDHLGARSSIVPLSVQLGDALDATQLEDTQLTNYDTFIGLLQAASWGMTLTWYGASTMPCEQTVS